MKALEFLLYFVLRRIFVRLELSGSRICVSKGLILRRYYDIPLASVIRVEICRTPVMRILRGKRAEIITLSGSVRFYLREWEGLPFLPDYSGVSIKAGVLQSAAGAFVDTKALSGVVTFALLLSRIGRAFGSESFGSIMSALLGAADEVQRILGILRIGVPRVTAFAAVFVSCAWLLVFIRKAAGMMNFRLSAEGGYITVRRGIFTLYEYRLVRNNLRYCVRCDTLTTLMAGSAPLYADDVMLFPPLNRQDSARLIECVCRFPVPDRECVRVPLSALPGHCAVPLVWLAVFSGGLLLTFAAETEAGLIRPVLWLGIIISLWYAVTYAVYMSKSGASHSDGITGISFRSGARLYAAVVPDDRAAYFITRQNIFQRFSGMCDIAAVCAGKKRFKLRNIPKNEIERLFNPKR